MREGIKAWEWLVENRAKKLGQKVNARAEALRFALYRSKRRMFPSVAEFLAGTEVEELAKESK